VTRREHQNRLDDMQARLDDNPEQTSIRRFFRLLARSSVGSMSNGFVRRS